MKHLLTAEFLERALDHCELGIVVTDLDGSILSVSEKTLELTGYLGKELIGASPRTFKSGHTSETVYQNLWNTIRTGHTWKGALLNRHKDGSLFLDRETILSGVLPSGKACFVALHQSANTEMELRVKMAKTEANLANALGKIDQAKSTIESLVTQTNRQLGCTANALNAAVEARDTYTAGHGARTALMMDLVGAKLDLFTRYSRDAIRIGATLHDIGKVGIPDTILWKRGPLTEPEYEVVKTHPVIGFDILKPVYIQEEVLRIVRSHHERLDGSGYPDGLKSHAIPDYVKAFSVCDCYDAMTSTRGYRPAMSPEDAFSILVDEALLGRLDMSAVKALKRLYADGVLNDLNDLCNAA
ncbi:MAG: HD domain-containing protein [Fimbriimonadaceae bacterium]|nr:HD domain-containing protein [Chthonomonadaceae bacterium]MCO5296592.1 HD domain-containing protein [Fimbriimonadaceae bacterium]